MRFRQANGKLIFDYPPAKSLDLELDTIAMRLYVRLTPVQLSKRAADSSFLNKEIDILFNEYAPDIWSMDSDRTHLLEPSDRHIYAKHLVYEDDSDRKLLRIYLHQWTFIKAFGLFEEFGCSEEAKTRVLDAWGLGPRLYMKSVVPKKSYPPAPMPVKADRKQVLKRKASVPISHNQSDRGSTEQSVENSRITKQRRVGSVMSGAAHSPTADEVYHAAYQKISGLTNAFLDYIRDFDQPDFKESISLVKMQEFCRRE